MRWLINVFIVIVISVWIFTAVISNKFISNCIPEDISNIEISVEEYEDWDNVIYERR